MSVINFLLEENSGTHFSTKCGLDSVIKNQEAFLKCKVPVINCGHLGNGITIDIWLMILIKLCMQPNISVKITPVDQTRPYWETTENACTLPFISKVKSLDDVYHSTIPVFGLSSAAIYATKKVENQTSMFQLFWTFKIELWLILAAYYLLIRAFKAALVFSSPSNGAQTFQRTFSYLGFFSALFVTLYRSGLLSNLLVKTSPVWFDDEQSLARLVRQGQAKIVIFTGFGVNSSESDTQITAVQDALRDAPQSMIKMPWKKSVEYVKQHPEEAVIIMTGFVAFQMSTGNPRLRVVPMSDGPKLLKVIYCYRNTSEFVLNRLNQAIGESWTEITDVNEGYLKGKREHYAWSKKTKYARDLKSLGWHDYAGVFILLTIGFLISFCFWLLEIFRDYFRT